MHGLVPIEPQLASTSKSLARTHQRAGFEYIYPKTATCSGLKHKLRMEPALEANEDGRGLVSCAIAEAYSLYRELKDGTAAQQRFSR